MAYVTLLERLRPQIEALLPLLQRAEGPSRIDRRYARVRTDGHTTNLERALAQCSELAEFHDHARVVGGTARPATLMDLAEWLTVRAHQVGVAPALSELEAYLSQSSFAVRCVIVVGGIQVVESRALGEGVTVTPFSVNDFILNDSPFPRQLGSHSAVSKISAALFADVEHPKLYSDAKNWRAISNDQFFAEPFRRLVRAKHCLSLVKPAALIEIGRTVRLPAHVPICDQFVDQSYLAYCGEPEQQQYTSAELERGRSIHEALCNLPNATQERFTVPLSRLERALAAGPTVDAFIDLGIGLESLLLDDKQGELQYRLAVRGAKLLGTTVEERERISTDLTDLYNVRSSAVHSGVLPRKVSKQRSAAELYAVGCHFTAQAAEKIIRAGKINWNQLVLS